MALCHCALDDRSPSEVVAPNQPLQGASGSSSAGEMPAPVQGASGSASGAAAGDGSGGAAGGAGAATGVDQGMPSSSGGTGGMPPGGAAGGAASGGSTAGSTGMATGLDPSDLLGGGSGSAPGTDASCPAFTPCGGELAGSWVYEQVCPTANVGPLQVVCPTGSVEFEPGGAATLSFSDGQVVREGAPVGDSVVLFPAECALGSCASIAALVGGAGQCSEVEGGCACRTPFSVDWGEQSYAVSGSELRLADGRTFEYCVQAERLTYRETGSAREPGVFSLQRN